MTTTRPTRIGKTTVAASVGSIFVQLRQDGRVVAIDADTSFGKLAARIDPHAVGSYWNPAADDHLDTFSDVRTQGRHQRRRTVLLVLGWFPNAKRMKADGHTGRDIAK